MVAFSLAGAFQFKKKNSSLIGSSTLILGSEEAPTRTLVGKKNNGQTFINHSAFKYKGSVTIWFEVLKLELHYIFFACGELLLFFHRIVI